MDLVARFETDVFAIELPGAALVNAVNVARRLKSHIESCPLQLMDEKLTFRISVGCAEAQPGEEVTSLVSRAEEAMVASCESMGNHVHMHNGISVETAIQKSQAASALAVH